MGNKENNDNEIVIGNLKGNNNNNDNGAKSRKYELGKKVDFMAEKLASMLGAKPESMPFLYKAAWTLSEARIWYNAEQAAKGKNPMGLFIFLCKRDGV